MTPQERDLIESVFSRLAQTTGTPKDPEAQALIAERIGALPDAAYGLVQAVLVQENIIKQAQLHIADLERRLAEPPAATSASFLNAGAANPWAQSPRPAPQQQQPAYPQPPVYQQQQPIPQASPWGQPAAAVGGGSFLRQAAMGAAGVAGGILVAEGISSLFSGHHGGFGGGFGGGYDPASGFGQSQPEVVENVVVNNYYGDSAGNPVQSADYSPSDDGFSSGGSDDWT